MIGIDEVGRGCWAGPLLVVAARATGPLPNGLADSKTLSKKRREALFYEIKLFCELGEGWVQPSEIDENGLTKAMQLGVERALGALGAGTNEEIIMDGNINYCPLKYANVTCVIDADALHPIVGAASIYAKVLRDKYMAKIAKQLPGYGFDKHVGYGTKTHMTALIAYGVTEHHRISFKPIKKLVGNNV